MELDGTVLGKFGKAGKQLGEFGTVHAMDCKTDNDLREALKPTGRLGAGRGHAEQSLISTAEGQGWPGRLPRARRATNVRARSQMRRQATP